MIAVSTHTFEHGEMRVGDSKELRCESIVLLCNISMQGLVLGCLDRRDMPITSSAIYIIFILDTRVNKQPRIRVRR